MRGVCYKEQAHGRRGPRLQARRVNTTSWRARSAAGLCAVPRPTPTRAAAGDGPAWPLVRGAIFTKMRTIYPAATRLASVRHGDTGDLVKRQSGLGREASVRGGAAAHVRRSRRAPSAADSRDAATPNPAKAAASAQCCRSHRSDKAATHYTLIDLVTVSLLMNR